MGVRKYELPLMQPKWRPMRMRFMYACLEKKKKKKKKKHNEENLVYRFDVIANSQI